MGGRKPERPLQGRRLIDPVLDLVRGWGAPARLSVRHHNQVPGCGLTEILDRTEVEGPLAGVFSALDWGRSEGLQHVLILPCDAPYLPETLLHRLARHALECGKPVMPVSNGQPHPACALWRSADLSTIERYYETGQSSLMGALRACHVVKHVWADEPKIVFCNINSPQDLERYELQNDPH